MSNANDKPIPAWNRAPLANARRLALHYHSVGEGSVPAGTVAADLDRVVADYERAVDEICQLYAMLAALDPDSVEARPFQKHLSRRQDQARLDAGACPAAMARENDVFRDLDVRRGNFRIVAIGRRKIGGGQ